MEKLVDEFRVRLETGEIQTLQVFESIIPAGSFANPNATIPGLKRIEDEDGNGVNYIDDDNYEIVALGVKAVRIAN